jgi:hypothetical protein
VGDADVAWSVAELLHAAITVAAASNAVPATTVLFLFTNMPFVVRTSLL